MKESQPQPQPQPQPPRKLLPKPHVSSVQGGPFTQATAPLSSSTLFPEPPSTSTSSPGQPRQQFLRQPPTVNTTLTSSTIGPQLPAIRAHALPPPDSRPYTPLQTTPSTLESRVFQSQSPTERRSYLAGQLANEIITSFDSPNDVDVHKLFENRTPQQKREFRAAFNQEHPKIDVARKQLNNEEKRLAREETHDRITRRTEFLDEIWPGWMPQEIRSNYGPGGVPEKVINAIYRIVKEVTGVGSFEFDLFWTESGLFRQVLERKAPNTNRSRFTGSLAETAKSEVEKHLGQGGIEALCAAQLPQDTNPEGLTDGTLDSVSDPSSTAIKDEVTGTNIVDVENLLGNDNLSITGDGGLTLPEDDPLPDFGSFQDELEAGSIEPNAVISPPSKPSNPLASSILAQETTKSAPSSSTFNQDRSVRRTLFSSAKMVKRDASKMEHAENGPGGSRRKTGGLTADKIRLQLTNGQRLTDDVLHLLCRAIFLKHADANGHVVLADPLWFHNDTYSETLPSSIRSFDGEKRAVYFPIHHSGNHWALATLERVSASYILTYYDSSPQLGHFEGVKKRIKQWLDSSRQKNPTQLLAVEQSSPLQKDEWSCGLHVVSCLSSVLQGKHCPKSIDIGAEQRTLLQLLRETRVDKASRFSPDEAAALKDLKKGKSKAKLMTFDDRLSRCSLETLLQRFADAKERHKAAVDDEIEAREAVARLEGKMEMRDETRNMGDGVLRTVISRVDTKETQTPQRRSNLSSRRSSQVFKADSRISDRTQEVMDKLEDESDKKLSQEKTLYSEGVRMVVSELRNAGSGLEAEIETARAKLSLAEAEMMDAEKHIEGCEKAIQAKEVNDKEVRALADLDGLTGEKMKWIAAADNDEISLPDMDHSDETESGWSGNE